MHRSTASLVSIAALLSAPVVGGCARERAAIDAAASGGLVYIAVIGGNKDVMRARISDGAVIPVTRTPDREERWPYWSSHAGKLAYQTCDSDGRRCDLALWDPTGGPERLLTNTPARDERWPGWSPVDPSLVYVFRGRGTPRAGVALVDVETGETTLVAETGATDFFFRPNFSPDGRRLVAQRRRRTGPGTDLWILALDAPPRALTDAPEWDYFKGWFLRDGRHVVLCRRRGRNQPSNIAVVTDDGNGIRSLASTPSSDDHSPKPSPTRDEIALVSDREGSRDVFLADVNGTWVRNLTSTPERDEFTPRWSPDGELLVLTVFPAGQKGPADRLKLSPAEGQLVVYDREGQVLLETPGVMPDWMPPW